MKNKKMTDFMGLADEKYISEADPSRKRTPKKKFNWTALLAAACCFLLILNVAIVVPLSIRDDEQNPLGIGSADGSGFIDNIKNPQSGASSGLNSYPVGSNQGGTQDQVPDPEPPISDPGTAQFLKNPALITALDKFLRRNQFSPDVEINDALDKVEEEQSKNESSELEDFKESVSPDINDNQVSGVSEADIAKRSDKFLYYLRGDKLYVYSLKGAESSAECIFPLSGYTAKMTGYMNAVKEKENDLLEDKLQEELDRNTAITKEMFLSVDFKSLTVIMTNKKSSMTGIFVFDVSASPAVTLKSFHMLSGSYVSSRMVNGELLLFTRYEVPRSYNEDEPSTYIPFYVTNDKEYLTSDIYFPSTLNSNSYLTVTKLSHNGAVVKDSLSYLSFSNTLYVSKDNVYITRLIPLTSGKHNTEIVGINYSEGKLAHKGAVTVKGTVKNQYSLDEHDGILRIAVTSYFGEYAPIIPTYHGYSIETNSSGEQEKIEELEDIIEDVITTPDSDPLTGSTATARRDTSASLYCIDLSSWEIRARVENFAPKGEIVRSARFEGTNAYVCTSLQEILVDPVFFFDLSSLDNITYTETIEFEGYSSSLINFGDGYVVGIGYGETSSILKIDVYKEVGEAVEIVCSYTFNSTRFSENYKSYFIDRERHLIGLGISSRMGNSSTYEDYYLLLYFNGSYFDFVVNERVAHSSISSVRSFLQDGFVYVVSDTDFKVFETGSLDGLPFAPEEETPSNIVDTDTVGSTITIPGLGRVSVDEILNHDFSSLESALGRTLTEEERVMVYNYISIITNQ